MISKTLQSTTIYKGFNGWTAQTIEDINGTHWKITTLKGCSGKLSTTAVKGEMNERNCFTHFMTDSSIKLIQETARATEKSVRVQHAKALLCFEQNKEVLENSNAKEYEIEVGQVIFTDWITKDKEARRAIYEIKGNVYYTVSLDGTGLHRDDYIRPYTELCGIGTYYKENDRIELNKLANLVLQAKELEQQNKLDKEAKDIIAKDEKNHKIELGKKNVSIPTWAKSIIVADLYENQSDSQTDYFHTSNIKTVFLAFSKSTRNNMKELKKACSRFEQTKGFTEKGEEYENRYNFSSLPSYYFGDDSWSGYKVNKRVLDLKNPSVLEMLYIASAEGLFLANHLEPKAEIKEVTNEIIEGNIIVCNYSEKAGIVYGDTKPFKEVLKQLGCRFNAKLTVNDQKVVGWVFSLKKLDEIKTQLKKKGALLK